LKVGLRLVNHHLEVYFPFSLIPRPLIQRVYCLQYNARDTESDPRWGWFGSGTETTFLFKNQFHPWRIPLNPKPFLCWWHINNFPQHRATHYVLVTIPLYTSLGMLLINWACDTKTWNETLRWYWPCLVNKCSSQVSGSMETTFFCVVLFAVSILISLDIW